MAGLSCQPPLGDPWAFCTAVVRNRGISLFGGRGHSGSLLPGLGVTERLSPVHGGYPPPPAPQAVLPRCFFLRPTLVSPPHSRVRKALHLGIQRLAKERSLSWSTVASFFHALWYVFHCLCWRTMVHLLKVRLFPCFFFSVINITWINIPLCTCVHLYMCIYMYVIFIGSIHSRTTGQSVLHFASFPPRKHRPVEFPNSKSTNWVLCFFFFFYKI